MGNDLDEFGLGGATVARDATIEYSKRDVDATVATSTEHLRQQGKLFIFGTPHPGTVSISNKGLAFEPGEYTVDIVEHRVHQNRYGAHVLAVDTIVQSSTNPRTQPGDKRSWVVSVEGLGGAHAVRQFVAALMKIHVAHVAHVTSDMVDKLFIPPAHKPTIPLSMLVRAYEVMTKTGKPYTKLEWTRL